MKGLKKIALASAIAAVSAGAQAELKALDDSAMGELTGQAGLTIDLETKYTIGEFMYKDAGSVFFKGISLGASEKASEAAFAAATGNDGFVDNIRIKLDIAGASTVDASGNITAENGALLDQGFSRVRDLAAVAAAAAVGNGANPDTLKFATAAGGAAQIGDVRVAAGLSDNAFAGNAYDASGNLVTGTYQTGVDASGNPITEATTGNQNLSIGGKKLYNDGDLVIHVSFKDAWQKSGGLSSLASDAGRAGDGATLGSLSFEETLEAGLRAVDFNFSIDAIGLAAEAFEAGDSLTRDLMGHTQTGLDADGTDTTVLISGLSVNGYLGVVDIHIENNGNGFSTVVGADASGNPIVAQGVGDADSKINWDTYINITDLDVYLDIAGVQITDLKINNVRGDVTDLDGNFAFGFAHSKRDIYAVKDTAGLDAQTIAGTLQAGGSVGANALAVAAGYGVDGVAINTEFKGDMEIGALSFGDTGDSIGELYWTDIHSTTNWTISAH